MLRASGASLTVVVSVLAGSVAVALAVAISVPSATFGRSEVTTGVWSSGCVSLLSCSAIGGWPVV